MNSKVFEDKFLDYLDGRLSEEEQREMESVLDSDPELKRSFLQYSKVLKIENLLAQEKHELALSAVARIMVQVDSLRLGLKEHVGRIFFGKGRWAWGSLATFAAAMIAIVIFVDNQAEIESDFHQLKSSDTKDITPVESLASPELSANNAGPALPMHPGMRAVTIAADAQTGLEGWAMPGASVDVALTYMAEGRLTTKLIVQNAKVLSYSGSAVTSRERSAEERRKDRARSTISLEVSPADALTISTAKNLGSLSLMLRSPEDVTASTVLEINRGEAALDGGSKIPRKDCNRGVMRIEGREYQIGCDGSITSVGDSVQALQAAAGMQLVTVQIEKQQGFEQWLRPSQRVDIALSYKQGSRLITKLIVEKAEIVSYPKPAASVVIKEDRPSKPALINVSLQVKPEDALKLRNARQAGKLFLLKKSTDNLPESWNKRPSRRPCKGRSMMIGDREYQLGCSASMIEVVD